MNKSMRDDSDVDDDKEGAMRDVKEGQMQIRIRRHGTADAYPSSSHTRTTLVRVVAPSPAVKHPLPQLYSLGVAISNLEQKTQGLCGSLWWSIYNDMR
ncbi:hypothetical protein PIB30_033487 [Stylosanthes scabra]|uniref:Uncharacterized protein n=1 Tax=Stylosanthes scabra TaxID=79078 RepID=A0ABU6YAX0_9FABA|nr:hypothetical protein [Stylosanthes scabra]